MHAQQRLLDQNYKSLWVPDLTCPFEHAKQRDLHQNIKYIWVPALICRVVHAKQRLLILSSKSLWVPDITCRFVHAIQHDVYQNHLSLWVPTLICGFSMQTCDFWSKITSLYGSQTWPVVLCMQNGVITIRNTSLYGSQPSCVVLGCKTATFGPEYQVSMCPRYNLSFCACKTAW